MPKYKKQVEIYQRIKKENPCIFCLRSDGGCQLKGNKCDSTSLKMYYERNHLEIESILKDIYIKELEKEIIEIEKVSDYRWKENEQLKAQIEKMKCCWNCKHPAKDSTGCCCPFAASCHNRSLWEMDAKTPPFR